MAIHLGRAVGCLVLLICTRMAAAQPAAKPPAPSKPDAAEPSTDDNTDAADPDAAFSNGFIGRARLVLEVDDCPAKPTLPQDKLISIAREHYNRGEILYVQGEYAGAVQEFTASYCLYPYFTILKDIGQAYERQLDYQRAIAYLERYVFAVPADAKPAGSCGVDPQQDRKNVAARVSVLSALPARIKVTTSPEGAAIAMVADTGIAARGVAGGKLIETRAGHYEMTATLEGYETVTQEIDVEVGKPYGYYISLPRQKGQLSVVTVPDGGRVTVDNRVVGTGSVTMDVIAGDYQIHVDLPGRISVDRTVTVLPKKENRVVVELPPTPETGRTQLLPGLALGGMIVGLGIDAATTNQGDTISFGYSFLGLSLGAGAAYLAVPRDIPLGTSSLTITGILTGTTAGGALGSVLSSREEVAFYGASIGAATVGLAAYIAGRRLVISSGDAALINSGVIWGTTAGAIFANTFEPSDKLRAGIMLSGLTLGSVSASLLTRNFDLSRRHVALIDLGGVLGLALGYSVTSAFNSNGTPVTGQTRAHFSLAGLAVGILGGALLTRNLDAPRSIGLSPQLSAARDVAGNKIMTLGIGAGF